VNSKLSMGFMSGEKPYGILKPTLKHHSPIIVAVCCVLMGKISMMYVTTIKSRALANDRIICGCTLRVVLIVQESSGLVGQR
jgi:hypothetical protein